MTQGAELLSLHWLLWEYYLNNSSEWITNKNNPPIARGWIDMMYGRVMILGRDEEIRGWDCWHWRVLLLAPNLNWMCSFSLCIALLQCIQVNWAWEPPLWSILFLWQYWSGRQRVLLSMCICISPLFAISHLNRFTAPISPPPPISLISDAASFTLFAASLSGWIRYSENVATPSTRFISET